MFGISFIPIQQINCEDSSGCPSLQIFTVGTQVFTGLGNGQPVPLPRLSTMISHVGTGSWCHS